ncbi:hypothetical protein [Arenibacter sp. P308M17]|jgi:hypothetical protein|uniref:hypothetical protein n=1 Tax=unclassified Arenibacter TaxID=2615047 RepID=UPI000E34B410|nr:hypothetical protein [Arenibacter sp. A80]RFT55405.1 hypothetical protein D0S24_15470 [Arenibacter sp. P308M17]
MKNFILMACLVVTAILDANAQQFKVITSVESIVPNGLGRSRIISATEDRDYKEFTSEQTEEDNTRNKSDRGDIRVKNFEETKLLNFYNIGGIRFQNIAANDALISSKLNAMVAEGWELAFVTSAVESDSGKDDGQGIFITRYIFKK